MYLEQFKRDRSSILKYVPFVLGFLGFMAFNILVSMVMSIDTGEMIQQSIERMGRNVTFFTFLVPFVFFLVLLFLWWKFIHGYALTQLSTGRKKIDRSRIVFSFVTWMGLNILIIAAGYLWKPEDFTFQFNAAAFIPLVLVAAVFIPIQTSFEEYFFRGYFMQFTAFVSKNRAVALFLSSVVFGLMHMSNPEVSDMGWSVMIFYIGCGFLLGIMTLMDEGLELALGFHAANNLCGALFITSETAVFQIDALFLYK